MRSLCRWLKIKADASKARRNFETGSEVHHSIEDTNQLL
tara:strand:- start:299 stop:415 length:117 start_codon:yes stop_codon:yes gene_type:complete